MSNFLKWLVTKEYRVVRDDYCGYEAQYRRPLFIFWRMVGFSNTYSSLEGAKKRCVKDFVVWRSSGDTQAEGEQG